MYVAEHVFAEPLKAHCPHLEIPSRDVSSLATTQSEGGTSPSVSSPASFAQHHDKASLAMQEAVLADTQTASWVSGGTAVLAPGDQSVHGSPMRLGHVDCPCLPPLPPHLTSRGFFGESRRTSPTTTPAKRAPPALFKGPPPASSTLVPAWRPLDTPQIPPQNGLHLLLR
ncbi:hypothetical protein APUTEX25_005841, partial [Auxenochlorella protothecoides]